jgi:hypothetical protein
MSLPAVQRSLALRRRVPGRGAAPSDTGGPHQVTILPAAGVPCQDDFVVQLFIDDVGQLAAVNLLLGSAA